MSTGRKKRAKRRTGAVVLSEVVSKLSDAIEALPPNELQALICRADELNTTNCWWFEYDCRQAIAEFAGRVAHKNAAPPAQERTEG